jgi:hypothetical protein
METSFCPDELGKIWVQDEDGNYIDVESDPIAAKTLFNEKYKCAGKIKFLVSLAHEKIHQRQLRKQPDSARQFCEKTAGPRLLQSMEIEAYKASIAEAERLLQEKNCSR